MIQKKTVLAVILARGGSKRLPNKNIRLLAGKPLISWTIKSAKESKYIDRVIVSTDSQEIAKAVKQFGAEVPFERPKELASNEASSESGILHVLEWIKKHEAKTFDYCLLLQPTSPLRTATNINEALELLHSKKDAHTLVSVTKYDKNPYWLQTINDKGYAEGYFDKTNIFSKPDRSVHMPNGAIFIVRVPLFLKHQKFYTPKTLAYVMDKIVSVDIDEELDFLLAELLAKT